MTANGRDRSGSGFFRGLSGVSCPGGSVGVVGRACYFEGTAGSENVSRARGRDVAMRTARVSKLAKGLGFASEKFLISCR